MLTSRSDHGPQDILIRRSANAREGSGALRAGGVHLRTTNPAITGRVRRTPDRGRPRVHDLHQPAQATRRRREAGSEVRAIWPRRRSRHDGGSVIELRGDEALAVFSSARQAIRAALDLQARFVEETLADPSLPLPVGIGLDAGEAVPVAGGYRGGALNLAARLCGQAGPGEVLASAEAVHLARKIEGVTYVDRGTVQLKGLEDPVRVIKVIPEGDDPADLLKPFAQPATSTTPPRQRGGRRTVLIAAIAIAVVIALVAVAVPLLRSDPDVEALPGKRPPDAELVHSNGDGIASREWHTGWHHRGRRVHLGHGHAERQRHEGRPRDAGCGRHDRRRRGPDRHRVRRREPVGRREQRGRGGQDRSVERPDRRPDPRRQQPERRRRDRDGRLGRQLRRRQRHADRSGHVETRREGERRGRSDRGRRGRRRRLGRVDQRRAPHARPVRQRHDDRDPRRQRARRRRDRRRQRLGVERPRRHPVAGRSRHRHRHGDAADRRRSRRRLRRRGVDLGRQPLRGFDRPGRPRHRAGPADPRRRRAVRVGGRRRRVVWVATLASPERAPRRDAARGRREPARHDRSGDRIRLRVVVDPDDDERRPRRLPARRRTAGRRDRPRPRHVDPPAERRREDTDVPPAARGSDTQMERRSDQRTSDWRSSGRSRSRVG